MLALSACAGGPFSDTRLTDAISIGKGAAFKAQWVKAGQFTLLVQSKITQPGQPIRIYFEGDGFAYMRPGVPSMDPSPKSATALLLAAVDPSPNVAWVARPCQYVMLGKVQKDCPERYWTTYRMAPETVVASDLAVTTLLQQSQSKSVELVGYSGGGAIAVLVAARRSDVSGIRTAAGNLDLVAFTRYHSVTPMTPSLNPADAIESVRQIPQVHYSGSKDTIVPTTLTASFVSRVGSKARMEVLPGVTHGDGWQQQWRRLLANPLP
jgi:pimeloyl-ACP methyl ester carboxylesterase